VQEKNEMDEAAKQVAELKRNKKSGQLMKTFTR
jgi:hypothetical protein